MEPVIPPMLSLSLKIGSGLFWTLTYILIIRKGFKDRTWGMPVVALCANLSWEAIFSFIHPHDSVQLYVNWFWFGFDVIILYQLLKFGDNVFYGITDRKRFLITFPFTLVCSFLAVLFITYEFNDFQGKYAAFSQNLMMSILFIAMLVNRGNSGGQSLYIAVFKMIGTVLPSILFHMKFPDAPYLNFLFLSILVFDIIYTVMVYRYLRKEGLNPWKVI